MKRLSVALVALTPIMLVLQACGSQPPPQAIVAPQQAPSAQEGDPQLMDIQDYVRQIFIEGVPFEETTTSYDSSVVPTLLEMLNDSEEEASWANIAVVLGIIGDEASVDPLIAFIEGGEGGQLSRSQYTAKTSALMAMGYLINKTGNEKALNYLIEGLDPDAWQERGAAVISPFQPAVAESNRDLSKHALLGLALSGNPTAAEALRSLQEPPETAPQAAFQDAVSDVLSEALEAHAQIAAQGLAGYYQREGP